MTSMYPEVIERPYKFKFFKCYIHFSDDNSTESYFSS